MPERLSIDDETFYHGYANHIQRYEFAVPHCRGRRVLDAGCGTGYGSDFLARSGAAEVVAVDIAEDALAEARRYYRRDNLRFLRADVERLAESPEVAGPFDVIVNFENLEHLRDPRAFIQGARRLLGPDGTLVLSSPNGDLTERDESGAIRNTFHVREYNAEELTALLQPEFPAPALFGQWRTPEGRVRVQVEQAHFDTMLDLYYYPGQRLWRAARRLVGRPCPPPPRFTAAGTSYPWEFLIRPLSERPFPWPPEVILALSGARG